jgi:hypothetical protein
MKINKKTKTVITRAHEGVLWVVTNKTPDGREKPPCYYTSHIAPQVMHKKAPTWVADVHDPRNQSALSDGTSPMYALRMDGQYNPLEHRKYVEKWSQPCYPDSIGLVIPYLSSEANPDHLCGIAKIYREVPMLSNPESLVRHSSKEALREVKNDPAASAISEHILPTWTIKSSDDYARVKKECPNLVLKAPRSTEGIGIYVDLESGSELPSGGINQVLAIHGDMIAVPYVDCAGGDMRVWAMADARDNITVLKIGALRKAGIPTAENPYPKCNVSSGGTCIPTRVNKKQLDLVERAMAYYTQNHSLRVAGYDIIGNGTKPLGPGMPSMVISEVNWSPDGWNYAAASYPARLVQTILTHCKIRS